MLPGVVMPSGGLPDVQQGDSCAITVVGNRSVIQPVYLIFIYLKLGEASCRKCKMCFNGDSDPASLAEHLLLLALLQCPAQQCTTLA